jgi:hypothetical protein
MLEQIKFVIDKFKELEVKSVLNIGYRHDSDRSIQNYIESIGGEFSVLEVWGDNCRDIFKFVKTVHHIDVKNIDLIEFNYDAVIWLHGPEHITWFDFLNINGDIERKAKKIVIYQMPIGEHPQGSLDGNPFEEHISVLNPEMFARYGYDIAIHKNENENTFSAYTEDQYA